MRTTVLREDMNASEEVLVQDRTPRERAPQLQVCVQFQLMVMMLVLPSSPPPPDSHGDMMDMTPFHDQPSGLKLNEEQREGGWSQEGDLEEFGGLDRKWLLWHDFMKEHAHLEMWLHLTEQAITCASPAHITYISAKETLRRIERLRWEAGSQLIQSDRLTHRNQTLTRLFRGSMRSRLLALARSCGQRCDKVLAELESITARLKNFVMDWEGFEEEREELSLWLADLDVRVTEMDHLAGNTCKKLQLLQLFQQHVCMNTPRLNEFLRSGEMLIQRCKTTDAEHIERELLELLRCRSHIFNNITRTHTRLLSMRLVFEDDHFLSQASDSGCPSESLLEEEEVLNKTHLGLPAVSHRSQVLSSPVNLPPRSLTPDDPVLEWDPSVDIGHSVCQDDAASSYFSSSTGVKRPSYLDSLSDIGIPDQEVELRLKGWLDHTHTSVLPMEAQWATSTPGRREVEPVNFDIDLIRAWLGVKSPAHTNEKASCSRVVQTEEVLNSEEDLCCDEQISRSELGITSSGDASVPFISPALLFLILAAFLLLLACLCWKSVAHRHKAVMPFSLHLMLTYVNGPPPT